MSIRAISYVLSQDIRPSSIKFVLVALADHAGQSDDDSIVWPSITSICQSTSQDRKTVIAALDALEKMRLLEDTGKRCGVTGQVKVYRIIGLPGSSFHYTYRLVDAESNYYIGVRSCYCEPGEDRQYMGSGIWPYIMRGKLTKSIISTYESRVEAEADEERMIRDAGQDQKCQNIQSRKRHPSNSPAPPSKQSRFSLETVPKAEHGTVTEPSGVTSTNRGLRKVKAGKPTNPLAIRAGACVGRKATTEWSEDEVKLFKKVGKRADFENELAMVERYYGKMRNKQDSICRTTLERLLKYWSGEVDRAKAWCEKNPLPGARKISAPRPEVVSLPPEVDPEANHDFLASYERQHNGRLPYGWKREGDQFAFVGSNGANHG